MQIPPWGPLAEVFMLDSGWHQGSSLLGQSSGQLRVLSVIPSGEVEDLHALWQACAALQAQGYPVMILDGLESETDQAPGLEDVLQGCSSTALPAHLTQPHAIASLPAARGLQELADWAQASGRSCGTAHGRAGARQPPPKRGRRYRAAGHEHPVLPGLRA